MFHWIATIFSYKQKNFGGEWDIVLYNNNDFMTEIRLFIGAEKNRNMNGNLLLSCINMIFILWKFIFLAFAEKLLN